MLEKQGVKVDKVLNFAIDDAILEERITGRWIHPSSGRSYHTKFAPPKTPGVDDVRESIHNLSLSRNEIEVDINFTPYQQPYMCFDELQQKLITLLFCVQGNWRTVDSTQR